MTKKQYNFNEQILNTLSVVPDDEYEAGVRGFCKMNSTNPTSWGIWISKPWMPNTKEDRDEYRQKLVLGGSADVHTNIADEYAAWDWEGLTKFRDSINEVLALWKDFANQESENLAKEKTKQ